ncbi:MAG TPA: LysM domain-containing protein [Capsulimonadaceae bacterium]|jgi:LysM repeat protein
MAVIYLQRPQYISIPGNNARTKRSAEKRIASHAPEAVGTVTATRRRSQVRFRSSDIESLFFAAIAIFAIGYLIHSAIVHTGPFASAPIVTKSITVTVAPGDTLWALASKCKNIAASHEERIDLIQALNPKLDMSRPLQAGRHLKLPLAISR